MDLAVPFIFISVLVIASFSLILVFKFGIKKKSYEEVLAEHRKQASALLGNKPKLKEKKSKKAAKKTNKEKSPVRTNPENETADDTESVDSKDVPEKVERNKPLPQQTKKSSQKSTVKASPKQAKTHVEFKEEAEEVTVKVPVEKEVKEVINKREDQKPEIPKEEKKPEKAFKKSKQQKQESSSEKALPVPESQQIEKEKSKEEKVESVITPVTQESVVNTGKEKKKKKSEYNTKQQMTAERDQLIHDIRCAELSRTEVQVLIDLLLNKQLEAPAVVDEWSEGKYDPVQRLKKQLAEKEKLLIDEQEALVGVQAKLKEVRNEQLAERAQLQQRLKASEESKTELIASHNRLQQKVQEVEENRSTELVKFQKLLEEYNNLEMHRDSLLMKCQEADNLIVSIKTENAHLNNELQRLTQEFQEQGTNYQACIIQIQQLQVDLGDTKEYVMNMERNHSFAMTAEIEEKRGLSEQLQRLTDKARKEEQRLLDVIEQLKASNEKLQEEKDAQVNNGPSEESKVHEVKVLNLTNELSSVKSELSSISQKFQDAEKQHHADLITSKENYTQLKSELEEQKNKNNELRKKNWKVMEALNAAESRNKPAAVKDMEVNIDKISSEIKSKEENAQKEFLQRLFPKIESLKSVSVDDWQNEFEQQIRQHMSQLEQRASTLIPDSDKSQEVAELHSKIRHYKTVIDDTEGTLNKFQSKLEQEERNWRIQLAQKDAEIQELKNERISQLQIKVSTLERQLKQEQVEKQRLLDEHQQFTNRSEIKTLHADSTATIEKLSEEVDRLKEQLRIEQTKNGDVSVIQNGKSS